jgi:cyclopropane-fatty-acyl-phospholipid synthase
LKEKTERLKRIAPEQRHGGNHMLAEQLSRYLGKIKHTHPVPARVVLWDGTEIPLGDETPVTIRLRDRRALSKLMNPSLDKLGDAYVQGNIDIDGPLPDAIRVASQLAEQSPRQRGGGARGRYRGRRIGRLPAWAKRHTRHADKQAISYHYDVSNAFTNSFLINAWSTRARTSNRTTYRWKTPSVQNST